MAQQADGRMLATLAMVTQLGFIMVACILAGFLLGLYLDRELGTDPVFTIALLLGGVAGGMVAAYRMIMQGIEEAEHEQDEDEQEGPSGPEADD